MVFDPKTKKVPNPKLEEEKAKREEEIKKRKEEYEKKQAEYTEKLAKYNEEKAKIEEENKRIKEEKDKKKLPEAPEKPVAPINPPEVPVEVEITEQVPRIALMSSDIPIQNISALYNVSADAQELRTFELKCQKVDQESLAYDAAINDLETIIYNTRDGREYALKDYITEEEAA